MEESRYLNGDALSSSIQNTDLGSQGIFASSWTSDSSGDSKVLVNRLPLHRAVVVVANAAIGAGMLNFPQAYEKSGGLVEALIVQMVS